MWCLCDWNPCQNAVVCELGSSVVYKKRAFEQTTEFKPSLVWQRETTELWRCNIAVFTNDRGGSRVDLRTTGYYLHEEERDTVRTSVDSAEIEIHELLRRSVEVVTEKYVAIADLYNHALTDLHPGLLDRLPAVIAPPIPNPTGRAGSWPTPISESPITAIWQGTAVATVSRDGSVCVNHNFLSPLQYCDRPKVRDVGIVMKTLCAAVTATNVPETVSDHRGDAKTLRETRIRSEELQRDIREQMQTLGHVFNMNQYGAAVRRLYPRNERGFAGPTLF